MSAFTSFAPELIHAISDQLDVCDIKSLRLTCKHLGELLACHVLRRLTIDLNKHRLDKDIPMLQSLASGFSTVSRGVRELAIISVDPGHNPGAPIPTIIYVDNQWVTEPEPEQPPEVKLAEKAIKICLFEAISSLKSVTTVRWTPASTNPTWAQQLVMNSLLTLPNLEKLHIATSHCSVKIPFDAFPPLRELSLTGLGAEASYPDVREDLVKLINKSPQLSSLNVEGVYCYRQAINKDRSLHGLLKGYPKGNTPLRLRELSMEAFLVRLDKTTLPHLRHLTSLKLRHIQDPYQEAGDFYRGIHPEVLNSKAYQDQKIYGSSRSDLWLALAKEGIQLQEIITDHASIGLLTYLESYSGLERLKLEPGGFMNGGASDVVASLFFETSIRNHIKSIQELDLNPPFEGGWCISTNSLPIVSSCTKLKDLRVCFISSQVQETMAGNLPPENIVKLFLDTVVMELPLLETLSISSSNSEGNRRAVCGAAARYHFARTNHLISQKVTSYKAPWTCNRLPRLMVGSRGFTPALETPAPETSEGGIKGRVKRFLNRGSRSDEGRGPLRMVYKPDFIDQGGAFYYGF